MATDLPDMAQIGTDIRQRLTNLESNTQTNANNLSSLESQIISVCTEVATGTSTVQTMDSEGK